MHIYFAIKFYRFLTANNLMAAGLLVILQILLYCLSVKTAYNYGETSTVVPFKYPRGDKFLSGFGNVINKDFAIGGLFPVYDCTGGEGNLELLEAMLFAIDRINDDISLLPNLTIGYEVRDTCNNVEIGFHEALHMVLKKPPQVPGYFSTAPLLGIIGAASTPTTLSVATLYGLPHFQFPLVGYASTSAALSNKDLYKYFLRTIPSNNLQAKAMADLVSFFGWEYVSVIFNDNTDGKSGSDAFIESVKQYSICIDAKVGIPSSHTPGDKFNKSIAQTVGTLLGSKASVVVVFTDEKTILRLFEELNKTNSTRKFVWIASDKWTNSSLVRDKFPEIASGMFGFQLHIEDVKDFTDYFSQLTPSTNIRNPFFKSLYHKLYCNFEGSGVDCPDNLTDDPSYSQGDVVPFVVDAVYLLAHAIQNFLDDNCDSPLKWDRTAQRCEGMKYSLTSKTLLGYIYNVTFNGIQNRVVTINGNGDPSGLYEIIHLQMNEYGQFDYALVGFWDSAYKENALILNNIDGIQKTVSRCSEPCGMGMIRNITDSICPSCFKCIPCIGPTYSMNNSANNCSLCSENHWGNDPLMGSTHCVPIEVHHFSSGWSIISMCIASIALLILAVITVVFVITWNTPVVKSSGREQMAMLVIGIGVCYILIYIMVYPPSTVICAFQRIGVWLCFSLSFGALFVKIIRVARIFYWNKSVVKRPSFTEPKYQVMFTLAIVAGQLILVVIGLGINPPVVQRDPDVVRTSIQQTGEAPEIVETCQQPHMAVLVLSLVYNFFIIVGCTILGWITRKFPENFNEARHIMFTSFTLMVIWVLFVPLYFSAEDEFQTGVLALGIVLSAIGLMVGIFFPRVYIIIFKKYKNTKEYVSQQSRGLGSEMSASKNFSASFQQSKALYGSVPAVLWCAPSYLQ